MNTTPARQRQCCILGCNRVADKWSNFCLGHQNEFATEAERLSAAALIEKRLADIEKRLADLGRRRARHGRVDHGS